MASVSRPPHVTLLRGDLATARGDQCARGFFGPFFESALRIHICGTHRLAECCLRVHVVSVQDMLDPART